MKPQTRKYIYGIIAAAVPLLVTLGIITQEVSGHLMAIASSILATYGSVLAITNINEDE
jgi:hypothetical protein